ncbi:MAG TPA: homoserine dehydrogenase [Thermoanaerobaculia bacterium]|nr:homoserine dehydrogenase [Thermoanaerobaculia bacterium]
MRARIGLLGCGTVGRGFVQLVDRERERIRARTGVELEISKILVRDVDKPRGVDRALLTTSALDVIDAEVDVVVELVGGVHCAGAYVRRAIDLGRHIVTANKALLAAEGRELFAAGRRRGVRIGFEASVCGGVPVVRALQRGLAGDSIESIAAILNGTCNYVLTRMEDDGLDFDDALAEAQAKGFAEADPALDIDGHDAAQKLRILAGVAFDAPVRSVRVHGIRDVTLAEVEGARSRRSVVRHVATARRVGGGVELRVERRELPEQHPLAAAKGENNAVLVRGRAVGEMLFAGKGAGSLPTAAAVLSDVVEITAQFT